MLETLIVRGRYVDHAFIADGQLPDAEGMAQLVITPNSPVASPVLSAKETKLIERINRGLPMGLRKRYAQLTKVRKKSSLTTQQHQELLDLTHETESRDADRAAALVELAKLRRVSVRWLMKQMGIQAAAVHG